MARKKRRKTKRVFYRINHYIQADQVRVVDEKGKQVGVMPLNQALKEAQEKKLDLVEVAPRAKPPVCKIIDFKKFKFLEAKKQKAEKKKAKKVELKEFRLTPFIGESDFNFRLERAEEFLKEGDRVKISVFFRGRQMTKKDFGYKLLKKVGERLKSISRVEIEPKFVGRRLEMVFAPSKGSPPSSKAKKGKPSFTKVSEDKQNGQKTKTENQKVSQKKI